MKLLDVVYIDNHVLVVNKPPGIPTQPSLEHEENLEDFAKAWLKEKFNKKGNVFLNPIHRLDKEVSGLVLFARTSKALSRLQADMRNKKIRRIYYAEVEGHLKQKEGTLTHFLEHGDHRAIITQKGGKIAKLHYRVLEEREKTSSLEIELDTGRYHQIRAQMAAVHHPVVGDAKYGHFGKEFKLHHSRLIFYHPVTKKHLEFFSQI